MSYNTRVGYYNTVFNSTASTIKIIFGKFDVGFFDETVNKYYAFMMFMVINLIQVVIMLNTLIAILANSYSKVKQNSVNFSYKQKLNLIND